MREQIENEYKYLGYGVTTILNNETNIKYKDYAIVVGLDTKYAPKITVYYILTGEEKKYKIMRKKYYLKNGKAFFGLLDMIRIKRTEMKPKRMKIDDEWIDSETEKEEWIEELGHKRVKKKEDE